MNKKFDSSNGHPDPPRLLEGRWPNWETDEVVVGRPLVNRMKDCALGDTLKLNTTPFKVVGIYEFDNAQGSEIWGPVDRMLEALDRPAYSRVIARMNDGVDYSVINEELEEDPRLSFEISSYYSGNALQHLLKLCKHRQQLK